MFSLSQNLWSMYGFRNNPYDTNALSLYTDSLLPISKAYVGRSMESRESQILTNVLRSAGGNRVVVEGEIGVGKTTFVNYHRYIWENEAIDKLFSPVSEISFSLHWDRCSFLINVLSHITNKLYMRYGKKLPYNNEFFQELLFMNKVFVEENNQWQINLFQVGVGMGKEKQVSIPAIPEAKLYEYFRESMKTLVSLGYSGIILHFDNLELVQHNTEACRNVFEEIRDILQTPNVYSIFVAKTGFFNNIISPLERVRSIFFGWPVFFKPLSKNEVLQVLQLRYELLVSQGISYIKPVEDDVILYLYDIYEGKIRFIMDAIHAIIAHFPMSVPQIINLEKAKSLLQTISMEKAQNLLSSREINIFTGLTECKISETI